MRTRGELEIEARRLEQRAREVRLVPSNRIENSLPVAGLGTAPLFTFPEGSVKLYAPGNSEPVLTTRIIRHVEASECSAGFEYKLMAEEFISDAHGKLVRHYDPIDLVTSDHVLDVLTAGFQRLDEDRFREQVEPVGIRIEANGFTQAEHAEAVAEVERYASEMDLSASARMRVKSATIDFLEGRLETGDFVARTVARQERFAVVQRAVLSRQITESIEI